METKRIDTSIEGFRYVGINLTKQQYEELQELNALILMNGHRQKIPVFNIMIVLKILGLLPSEMIYKESDKQGNKNFECNFNERLQRKFGKFED